MIEPRLRNVEKYAPPYQLNNFPPDFPFLLGKELVFHLASKGSRLEGQDWEEIFSRVINATWKPSNVGLDDVVLGSCAWGAKTVKNSKPSTAKKVRLISGRNSPSFSYDVSNVKEIDPNELGKMVLSIWNERVWAVKKNYKHVRTIVLLKSNDLLEVATFEFETTPFNSDSYTWNWNNHGNLEGRSNGAHRFTWQPHGSQFTVLEDVPLNRLALRLRKPPEINPDYYLKSINFDSTWIERL